ncbi:MAG: hypothetical protein GEV12_14350 [Micromonosporaceae bacterium]|nr:hypothetical protein [Micromonosporaceae bacterium]
MTFPDLRADVRVEVAFGAQPGASSAGWQWTDVSGDRLADPISIERGRQDEASQVGPGECTLSLDNPHGHYTPDQPLSPHYPDVVEGVPLRVSVGRPHVGAGLKDLTQSTSHVAPGVTMGKAGLLICAWASTSAARDYTAPVSMTEQAEVDGNDSTMMSAIEVLPAAGATGTRVATTNLASAWVATTIGLHGDTVTVAEVLSGVRTAANATKNLTLTTAPSTVAGQWLVAVQYYGVIATQENRFIPDSPQDSEGGWVLLGDSDTLPGKSTRMRAWARRVTHDGAHAITFVGEDTSTSMDNHGHLYVLSGVDDWSIRAMMEVGAWGPSWPHGDLADLADLADLEDPDARRGESRVAVDAAGILRRLGQGQPPVPSALARFTADLPSLVRRWPLENDATREGIPERNMRLLAIDVVPEFGPRPTFGADAGPPGTPRSLLMRPTHEVRFDASAAAGWAVQLWLTPGESALDGDSGSWAISPLVEGDVLLSWETDGTIGLFLQDEAGFSIGSDTDTIVPDGPALVTFFCAANGSQVTADVNLLNTGQSVHLVVLGLAQPSLVNLGGVVVTNGATFGATTTGRDVYVSHVAVGQAVTWQGDAAIAAATLRAGSGWAGETAGRRMERLCGEQGIVFRPVGDLDQTALMGPQPVATLLENLRECEAADQGILYEPRQTIGLGYRTLASLYNQLPRLSLDAGAGGEGDIVNPFLPVQDDQAVRNAVTVEHPEGNSFSVVDEANVARRGRYEDQRQINVLSFLQLPDVAGWLLHLGTWPGMRYPAVSPALDVRAGIVPAWEVLDVGDVIPVSNLPPQHPTNVVALLAQGYAETIRPHSWGAEVNCSPAGPYTVGVYADVGETPGPDEPKRYSSDGTFRTIGPINATGTSIAFTITQGPFWTTDPAALPFDILVGGERMRVTNIAAPTGSFQTFTVIRSINGVVKEHPDGVQVHLWKPARYAL